MHINPRSRFSTIRSDTSKATLKDKRLCIPFLSATMLASVDSIMYGLVEDGATKCLGIEDFMESQKEFHESEVSRTNFLAAYRTIDWKAAGGRKVKWD